MAAAAASGDLPAASGDLPAAGLLGAALSRIAASGHPSNDLGIFSPDLFLRPSRVENKTDSKSLGVEECEGVGSQDITAREKMLSHVVVNGVGLYTDWSESIELLQELARQKKLGSNHPNSVVVLHDDWRLTSTDSQSSVLPPIPRSRMPCIFIPAADGAFFGSPNHQRSFYVMNSMDMRSACLLYSREGWLFLSVPETLNSDLQIMFLMNPFSGEVLTLPPAPNAEQMGMPNAAFTIGGGRPDLVIFPCLKGQYIHMLVSHPGDEKWEEHTARVLFSKCIGLWNMLLCGRSVYCFFDSATTRLMVFHLDGQNWSTYGDVQIGPFLIEFEGRVLTVDPPLSYVSDGDRGFLARELIIRDDEASVVRLRDDQLSNKSWFLGGNQSFCARMMGQKVYQFKPAPQKGGGEAGDKFCVYYHDLLKKKFRLLTPDAFDSGFGWVDSGGVVVTRYPRTRARRLPAEFLDENLN
ncbi:hypothetical protein ACP4OV_020152 [Aristida adscensionis]